MKSKEIQFTNYMEVATKKKDFLSNSKNKSVLISKLKTVLEGNSMEVTVSQTDADTDIVSIALEVVI